MHERCFACDRVLGKNPTRVDTRDAQTVFVGSECAKHILAAGDAGWQPPKGGPRLFPLPSPGTQQSQDLLAAADYLEMLRDLPVAEASRIAATLRGIVANDALRAVGAAGPLGDPDVLAALPVPHEPQPGERAGLAAAWATLHDALIPLSNRYVRAIVAHRQACGSGLREAKDAVDGLMSGSIRAPASDEPQQENSNA